MNRPPLLGFHPMSDYEQISGVHDVSKFLIDNIGEKVSNSASESLLHFLDNPEKGDQNDVMIQLNDQSSYYALLRLSRVAAVMIVVLAIVFAIFRKANRGSKLWIKHKNVNGTTAKVTITLSLLIIISIIPLAVLSVYAAIDQNNQVMYASIESHKGYQGYQDLLREIGELYQFVDTNVALLSSYPFVLWNRITQPSSNQYENSYNYGYSNGRNSYNNNYNNYDYNRNYATGTYPISSGYNEVNDKSRLDIIENNIKSWITEVETLKSDSKNGVFFKKDIDDSMEKLNSLLKTVQSVRKVIDDSNRDVVVHDNKTKQQFLEKVKQLLQPMSDHMRNMKDRVELVTKAQSEASWKALDYLRTWPDDDVLMARITTIAVVSLIIILSSSLLTIVFLVVSTFSTLFRTFKQTEPVERHIVSHYTGKFLVCGFYFVLITSSLTLLLSSCYFVYAFPLSRANPLLVENNEKTDMLFDDKMIQQIGDFASYFPSDNVDFEINKLVESMKTIPKKENVKLMLKDEDYQISVSFSMLSYKTKALKEGVDYSISDLRKLVNGLSNSNTTNGYNTNNNQENQIAYKTRETLRNKMNNMYRVRNMDVKVLSPYSVLGNVCDAIRGPTTSLFFISGFISVLQLIAAFIILNTSKWMIREEAEKCVFTPLVDQSITEEQKE